MQLKCYDVGKREKLFSLLQEVKFENEHPNWYQNITLATELIAVIRMSTRAPSAIWAYILFLETQFEIEILPRRQVQKLFF